MATHTMRWTALPVGLGADGRPRLSAHAAFRLDPGPGAEAMLADFPAALEWPRTAVEFTVRFRRGSTIVDVAATLEDGEQRRSDLWSSVFTGAVPVRGFAPPTERSKRRIRTFRTGRLADRWQDAYASLAASPSAVDDHALIGDDPATGPLGAFESVGFWARSRQEADQGLGQAMEQQLVALGYVPATVGGLNAAHMARRDAVEFRRYLDRVRAADPVDDTERPWDRQGRVSWVEPPSLDFHQLTTACAAHAALLRPLGLVFDLVPDSTWARIEATLGGYPDAVAVVGLPSTGLATDLATDVAPGVAPEVVVDETTPIDPPSAFAVDPSPWTRCLATSVEFRTAVDPNGDLSDRLLAKLSDTSRFQPVILDVEGTTVKAISLASTLQISKPGEGRRSRSTPNRQTVPTARASGIGIVRRGRSEQFHRRSFQRGDALVAVPPDQQELFAEDVQRGWRIDVLPEGAPQNAWRSLMRRVGRFVDLERNDGFELPDTEGWVSEVPAADAAGDLYLGEEVLRWDGWSPVAPKPGAVIDTEDQMDDRPAADPLPDLPVVISYQPTPGTLPTLRYGRRYQLRARAVDIAGNSVPPDSEASAEATDPVLFGRLDPVGSPDVLLVTPRRPGEELDIVVMRSEIHDEPTDEVGGRHLLPPRTTVVEAERHGVLDAADGKVRKDLYATLGERDAFTFESIGVPDPDDSTDDEGTSRYYPTDGLLDRLPVEYLPDPLARAIHVWRVDGEPFLDTPLDLSGGSWPEEWRAARLHVIEGDRGDEPKASWDPNERVLTVALAKADTLALRMSSGFGPKDLTTFALAEWVAERVLENQGIPSPGWPKSVEALADSTVGRQIRAGRNWMFTPWRPLTLVHAVKQPLDPPEIIPPGELLVVDRQPGEIASQLSLRARWHGTSTGRLDLRASWDEGIDLGPGTEAPRVQRIEALATELDRAGAMADSAAPGLVSAALRPVHPHGDTKYREFTYELEATTAFLEHFVETAVVVFDEGQEAAPIIKEQDVDAIESTVVVTRREADGTVVTYTRDDGDGGDYRVKGGFIVRLPDSTIPSKDELTVRFVTRPVTRRGNTELRVARASARPAAPVVTSVLPTFAWEEERFGRAATSRRATAGVRVWLERPWWSSGLGEQLAVVIQTGTAQPGADLDPFVTRWGRDPIHAAGTVVGGIADNTFPLRSGVGQNLRVPGGPVLRAVPHQVRYDADRDQWFCDIDVNLRSYWPFVRLALARYQPNAVRTPVPSGTAAPEEALSLSQVILADIVQVAPDRTAFVNVTRVGANRLLSVSLTGPSFLTTTIDTTAPDVEVSLQRRRRGASTSDLDWEPLGSTVTLTRVAAPEATGDSFVRRHQWAGQIGLLRSALDTAAFEYRVVFEEYERYRTDGAAVDAVVTLIGRRPRFGRRPRDGRRLVHLDVVPISEVQLA
ncbi:MAG TPA: hypothetical protein VK853_08555 [Ilumatobacteraceae bacterium]|nr:hypothetical protein [Ilumatobacteraceae bacterium]